MSSSLSQRIFGSSARLDRAETVSEVLLLLRSSEEQEPHVGQHRHEDDRVIVASPHDTVAAAQQLFRRFDLHHLPVTSADGKLLGIVSTMDLLQFFSESPLADAETTSLSSIMTNDPETIDKAQEMRTAVHKLAHSPFRCLPVLNPAGELTDILTTRDVVRWVALAYE